MKSAAVGRPNRLQVEVDELAVDVDTWSWRDRRSACRSSTWIVSVLSLSPSGSKISSGSSWTVGVQSRVVWSRRRGLGVVVVRVDRGAVQFRRLVRDIGPRDRLDDVGEADGAEDLGLEGAEERRRVERAEEHLGGVGDRPEIAGDAVDREIRRRHAAGEVGGDVESLGLLSHLAGRSRADRPGSRCCRTAKGTRPAAAAGGSHHRSRRSARLREGGCSPWRSRGTTPASGAAGW